MAKKGPTAAQRRTGYFAVFKNGNVVSRHKSSKAAWAKADRVNSRDVRYIHPGGGATKDHDLRQNSGGRMKRRTAAQIRATKKLVAMNKARGMKNPRKRKNAAGPGGRFKKWQRIGTARGQTLYWGVMGGDSSGDIYTSDGRDTNTGLYRTLGAARKAAKSAWYEDFKRNAAGPRKTPLRRLKSALQLRRGRKATAKWVRSGMPAQRNRPRKKAQCNPKRRGPTLTMAQGRKLYEMGKRAPKTPIALKTNGRKVSIVTGKAARRLASKGRR
jgi:hypothetical protein